MKKEKKSGNLPKEVKRYQKPTIVEMGKLVEETKGPRVAGVLEDSGGASYLTTG